MIIELKQEDLNNLFATHDKILIDIYATWCGPCKMLSTQIDEFAKNHKEWTVIRIDSDLHQKIASQYHVQAVPTMLFVIKGKVVETVVGFKPLVEIEKIASKY